MPVMRSFTGMQMGGQAFVPFYPAAGFSPSSSFMYLGRGSANMGAGYGSTGGSRYGMNSMNSSYGAMGGSTYPASNSSDSGASYSSSPSGSELSSPQRSRRTDARTFLTAFGLPNDDVGLIWPLGLQVLSSPTANRELLQQLDAQFQLLVSPEVRGQGNSQLTQETSRALDELHGLLRQKHETMLPALYKEAQRFLDKLDIALKVLQ